MTSLVDTRLRRSAGSRFVRSALTLAGVALAALIVGGVTSPAQGFLPEGFTSFANSASGWTMVTFLLVWLSRLRPVWAAVAGVVAFALMVEGYWLVSGWRGYGFGTPFQGFWSTMSVLVGPFVGAGAALLRYGPRVWQVFAVWPLVVIMIGDGIYGLTVVNETTSPVYWSLVIIGGFGIAVANLIRQRPSPWVVVGFVCASVAGVAAFLGASQLANVLLNMPVM